MASRETSRARTRLDPEVRRRQIAAAAARIFAERSPEEVTFEAVAEEAGVSRGLVYSYFGDRGGLYAAAYGHELAALDEQLDAAFAAGGDGREQIARAIDAYLRFAAARRESWTLIASAGSSRHPAVREAIDARVDRLAVAIGEGPRTRLVIRGLIGMLEAAAVHSIADNDLDVDMTVDVLTDIVWSGIGSLWGDEVRAS